MGILSTKVWILMGMRISQLAVFRFSWDNGVKYGSFFFLGGVYVGVVVVVVVGVVVSAVVVDVDAGKMGDVSWPVSKSLIMVWMARHMY